MDSVLDQIRDGLIVSCQPVTGGPMDNVDAIVAMALAARDGGAAALRIEGASNLRAVAAQCALPIIGIVKRDLESTPIRITPFLEDVADLAAAGAAIVAVDATARTRPVSVARLLDAIHGKGLLAMADTSNEAEAKAAAKMGFDIIGTTMSGYTGDVTPAEPDFALIRAASRLGGFVVAEGRFNSPDLARRAMIEGANAVCVGSAITRQEHITNWFRDAVSKGRHLRTETVLTYDIGGTKSMAALVRNGTVLDRRSMRTTDNPIGSTAWIEALATLAGEWPRQVSRIAIAATGILEGGEWHALNPKTLEIPPAFPLADALSKRLGLPTSATNDAQAAAWGEYRFGAGAERDMAFVTVSSGVGGGAVLNGRLLAGRSGMAGSLGQIGGNARLEDRASGFAMARAAQEAGRAPDTRALFADAAQGEPYALAIIDGAAEALASALIDLQYLIDPEVIVLGGGIGLLPDFRSALNRALFGTAARLHPTIVTARLGADAGIVGAAALPV